MEVNYQSFKMDFPYIDRIVQIYCEAHIGEYYKKDIAQSTKERFLKHSLYPGFRGIYAVHNTEVIGFVYGYQSMKGQFYRTQLESVLSQPESGEWLHNAYELVELAVSEKHCKKRIATTLEHKLLSYVRQPHVVLTTEVENIVAQQLYKKLGWEIIREVILLEKDMVIMGKKLTSKKFLTY